MPSKYLEASIRVVVGQEWPGGWRTLAQHLEQAYTFSPRFLWRVQFVLFCSFRQTVQFLQLGGVSFLGRGCFRPLILFYEEDPALHTEPVYPPVCVHVTHDLEESPNVGLTLVFTNCFGILSPPRICPHLLPGQNLFYSPQHDAEDFEASPRGFFRTISDGRGAGVVEIGPSADEVIVRVAVDSDGVVRGIQVVPSGNGGGEGEQGGAPQTLSAVVSAQGGDVHGEHGSAKTLTVGQVDVEAHVIYPAKHHVVGGGEMEKVMASINEEMEERYSQLSRDGRILEAERLRQRTENDCLLLEAVGTCKVGLCLSRYICA